MVDTKVKCLVLTNLLHLREQKKLVYVKKWRTVLYKKVEKQVENTSRNAEVRRV
jgi:hypothetical protein